MSRSCERLQEFHDQISTDLKRTVKFWVENSHDLEKDGFFNCLGKDGKVYDTTKNTWLQGRQIWTYSTLIRHVPEVFGTEKDKILDFVEKSAKFLIYKVKDRETNRCPFSTTPTGLAIKYQRSIYTEIFFTMAMIELYSVTNNDLYKEEGLKMLDKIIYWTQEDDTELGRTVLPGTTPIQTLAVPMVVLSLGLLPLPEDRMTKYREIEEKCVKDIMKHIQRNGKVILENVSPDGTELPGSIGRLMNPGHAIECGWFLLEYAKKSGNSELKQIALDKFIMGAFESGWDAKHQGLFYFLDVDGWSPTQLEWDMKLWWPHTEALIAFLMAYDQTQDKKYLDLFEKVFDYCYQHFVDKENGEWFGYLNRQGDVTHTFKGGPWKGCFHVPRCLMMCQLILKKLLKKETDT
ncbi:hypothetical protein LOTGIDRAFT_236307 [Lottia gigantea]|uniref:N-acylglucosamine 2-epimerase n=1 Tax=Lottia gigantea TaxID=225164 RepID=V3Z1E9_LOTGI|nr:hypothetical protein LOTGIDRAFT_236307 [Lottia gigantea]ESO84343.1 hypothetical protein LOTGIDRAFT_236307 [Lottia gigantea]